MWQENHLSVWDEIVNMAGCVVMFLSFVAAILIGMRYVSTVSRRVGK